MSILYTKITSYSRFIKLQHTVFALPFGLSAYLLILDKIGFKILDLIVLIIAISAIRTYGMAINRIIDRRIDAKNPRTKKHYEDDDLAFNFCKTAEKPSDLAVWHMVLFAKNKTKAFGKIKRDR